MLSNLEDGTSFWSFQSANKQAPCRTPMVPCFVNIARIYAEFADFSVGPHWPISALSPIGRIQILTYLIWGFLGAAIFDCINRSFDLFYWFIRTCLGPTVVPAAITSLELFCVLTMCYFSDNVSSKENIKILSLIFMFYYSDIIAIKNKIMVL